MTKQDQRKGEQFSCALLSRCILVTSAFMDFLAPCLIIGFLKPVNSPISICCNMGDQCRIYANKARLQGIQRGFLIKQTEQISNPARYFCFFRVLFLSSALYYLGLQWLSIVLQLFVEMALIIDRTSRILLFLRTTLGEESGSCSVNELTKSSRVCRSEDLFPTFLRKRT